MRSLRSLVLVDDDPIIRRGLRMRLSLEKDIQVVGEANDGQEAIELTDKLKPDIVVMDVVMLRLDGIAATAEIRARHPDTRVIILSLHSDEVTRARAKRAGAAAFITKGENQEELLAAIRKSPDD